MSNFEVEVLNVLFIGTSDLALILMGVTWLCASFTYKCGQELLFFINFLTYQGKTKRLNIIEKDKKPSASMPFEVIIVSQS